jgi:hypothetical protein
MKYLKMLGLAAVAAMALLAFLGASSASATTICTNTETPCSLANQYTTEAGHMNEIEASLETGTTATLKNTSGSIEDTCNTSTVKGSITNAGGAAATVTGNVTELAFGGCTNTTTVNNAAACSLEVHNIVNTDNGTVTGSGCTVTIVLFGVSCKFGVNNGTHLGVVTGGAMGTMDIEAVVRRIDGSSILCPETGLWEAKYTVTNPNGGFYVEP